MQTINIVLILAGVVLLILLAMTPCGIDHYADQIVHAGAGGIAGPIEQIDDVSYEPASSWDYFIDESDGVIDVDPEDDMATCIIGR